MDKAFGEDLSPQAAFVDESVECLGKGCGGEVPAWLAKANTENAHFTDKELFPGQRIQIDAAGYKIPSSVSGCKRQAGFVRKGVDIFLLDERKLEVGLLRIRRERSDANEVAISLDSSARDGAHFGTVAHRQ